MLRQIREVRRTHHRGALAPLDGPRDIIPPHLPTDSDCLALQDLSSLDGRMELVPAALVALTLNSRRDALVSSHICACSIAAALRSAASHWHRA